MGVFDSEEVRAKIRKAIEDSDVSIHPGTLAGYDPSYSRSYLGWDHPKADPLADLKAMYEAYGMPSGVPKKKGRKVSGELDYYTASDVYRFPYLKHCSKCGSERTTRPDPWITLKHCPNCGHVDGIRVSGGPEPASFGWEDVQKLLVGILRQVPDNKVQVHPAEFDTTGITFKQETDTATGIVTIWFETSDDPAVAHQQSATCTAARMGSAETLGAHVTCSKEPGHVGDHEALLSNWSTLRWQTLRGSETVTAYCSSRFELVGFGTLACQGVPGHKHPATKGHPGTRHYAKDPSSTDPAAFILWD